MAKRRKQLKFSERDYKTFLALYDRLKNPTYGKDHHYRQTELIDDFREFWPSLKKLALAADVELDISGFDWIESRIYNELALEDMLYLERKLDLVLVRFRKVLAAKSGSSSMEDEGASVATIKERFVFGPGQVLYDGKDIKVKTGKAQEILKKLVENFGSVVVFKELNSRSWECAANDALRGDIKHLRKKLKKLPIRIENRRGEGYMMCPND